MNTNDKYFLIKKKKTVIPTAYHHGQRAEVFKDTLHFFYRTKNIIKYKQKINGSRRSQLVHYV